ncbi:hypothetical protein [Enterobacter ludwigii]
MSAVLTAKENTHSGVRSIVTIVGKPFFSSSPLAAAPVPIYLSANAFPALIGDVLGQLKIDDKCYEIKAMLHLIDHHGLKGKIVTTDTTGCQKDITEKVRKREGD